MKVSFSATGIDFFEAFFGATARPPETVARHVLGIASSEPLHGDGIKALFRFNVKLLRPDLADVDIDRLAKVEADDEEPATERTKAEQLSELLWARDDLLARVPRPNSGGGASLTLRKPAPCPGCGGAKVHPPYVEGAATAGWPDWLKRERAEQAGKPYALVFQPQARTDKDGKPYWYVEHGYLHRTGPGRWHGYCTECAREGELLRQRALRRQLRADRVCQCCGATFTPSRTDGRHCSPACRQKAYRRRRAEVAA